MCDECQLVESNEHRLKECNVTKEIRCWVEQTIRQKMQIEFLDLESFIISKIDMKCSRQRAALWLASHYFAYVSKYFPKLSLFVFKKGIRELRWSKRESFRKHFEVYLNVC